MKEISLGSEFGAVAINVNDTRVEIDEDGKVKVFSKTPTVVTFGGSLSKTETAITSAVKALKIGYIANDGWIYAGLSEDSNSPGYNEPLWVAPVDSGVMDHYEAEELVERLHKEGKPDRLPTEGELNQIFNNLAAKNLGGFHRDHKENIRKYWTNKRSEELPYDAVNVGFSNGEQGVCSRSNTCSVRFVR